MSTNTTLTNQSADVKSLDFLKQRTSDELQFILEKAFAEWDVISPICSALELAEKSTDLHEQGISEKEVLLGKGRKFMARTVIFIICASLYSFLFFVGIDLEKTGKGPDFGGEILTNLLAWVLSVPEKVRFLLMLGLLVAVFLLIPSLRLWFKTKMEIKKHLRGIQSNEEYSTKFLQSLKEGLSKTQYLLLFPSDYCSPSAMKAMLKIIRTGRADTWQELADRYEELLYRESMEEQAKRAADLQHLNNFKLAEIGDDVRSAKIAAYATAAGVWR